MQDTITQIALEQLHESPFNPRKRFVGIEELAATIKSEGRIHQPLLVRPITPNPLRDDIVDGYEIVFGHRRFRAAALAGLATAPCMVRAMSDADARSAQTVENLQREDAHPIEEAEGFQALIEHDGRSADELAETFGKSRSYVYGRLKLLQACPLVRHACLIGEIGSEVALLIARLRTVRLQEKALQAIKGRNQRIEDGGQESYRRIRSLLMEEFTLPIKSALFAPEDDTLLPGAGACSACPKRAGNAPEFDDVANHKPTSSYDKSGGADVCTDPDCWAAKKAAHLAREAGKLRATGVEVVEGNKARAAISAHGEVKGGFVLLADVKALLKAVPKGGAAPKPVVIQDPRGGKTVKAYRVADLVGAGLMKQEKAAAAAKRPNHVEQYRQQEDKRKKQAERAEQLSAQRMALLQHVRAAVAGRPRDAFDLRLVAAAALGGVAWQDKDTLAKLWDLKSPDALTKRLDTMTVAELTTLVMDCALVDGVLVSWHDVDHSKPGPLLALAAYYGIDAKAVMQASAPPPEAAPTPSPATRAPKKATTGEKKPSTRAVKYRCPDTLMTWSGRGLQPKWLKVALANGRKLADFETKASPAAAIEKQTGDADLDRDPNTADMFEESGA